MGGPIAQSRLNLFSIKHYYYYSLLVAVISLSIDVYSRANSIVQGSSRLSAIHD